MPNKASKLILFPEARKAVKFLSEKDEKLKILIELVGSIRIKLDPRRTVFEALGTSIIYQQLHGKAAAKILERLKMLHKNPDLFPTPQQIIDASIDELRSVGLSGAKAKALKDLAEKAHGKIIPNRIQANKMTDMELIEALCQVRGIGRWTVEMFLIFTLGRTDILPIHDFGVRNGFMKVYRKRRMPTPKELEKFGARWEPYRTAVAWYLWRATELPQYQVKKNKTKKL